MGPLTGLRIIEMKGIGPGPYAGMLLADLGAEVVVISNPSDTPVIPTEHDVASRGKRSVHLNLKTESGKEALLSLIEQADALIEGFRPGVAERLGFGPEICLERNPRIVYGRMTGWGQDGPLATSAAHDINFISLTGAQAAIGTPESPIPPLNLVGDFGGGSLFLVMGILAALWEAQHSGKGQVIDAAITDGAASLMSIVNTMDNMGAWSRMRGQNIMDGAAPNYNVYKTADGKFVSIGPIEPHFYKLLLEKLELDTDLVKEQRNPANWPEQREQLAKVFKSKTRDEWAAMLEGTDTCFAPVLDIFEAPEHPHNKARGTYIDVAGKTQPAPAPRFSRSHPALPTAPSPEGSDTETVLADWGFNDADIKTLIDSGAAGRTVIAQKEN